MKIEGVDKAGRPWSVESEYDIEVRTCEQCGNPVAIISTSLGQKVQKVIFRKAGELPTPPIKIGEFAVEVIREHLKNFPEPCPWCGYPSVNKMRRAPRTFSQNHKGERCWVKDILCQEGYCSQCQIYLERWKRGKKRLHKEGG